jgi:ElaB/YqjD/DUF883 family membrane-anchored ribosome-binding protein
MDDFEKLVEEGKRSAQKSGKVLSEELAGEKASAGKHVTELGETAARNAQSFWEETKIRGKRAGERLGEEWEKVAETAQGYAREHSVGVALGSLGLGLVLGLIVGLLVRRD